MIGQMSAEDTLKYIYNSLSVSGEAVVENMMTARNFVEHSLVIDYEYFQDDRGWVIRRKK